jgi:hypothetical protein
MHILPIAVPNYKNPSGVAEDMPVALDGQCVINNQDERRFHATGPIPLLPRE